MVHFGEFAEKTPVQIRPPKVVILCGGKGERMGGDRPKPLVEIGGKPIVHHVMAHFGLHGSKDFLLALGYFGGMVADYFGDAESFPGWRVNCIPTGWDTQNGGRLLRIWAHLDETFFLAWCDGVTNLNLTAMLSFHRAHGRLCTVATVHPPPRFGELILDGDQVQAFSEKPQSEGWINAGFFVCEPDVLNYIKTDTQQWERDPLENLARDGELRAFRHEGFWQCMDTPKDQRALEQLWQTGAASWPQPSV